MILAVVAALVALSALAGEAQADGGWHPGYLDNAADGFEYVAIDSKGNYTPPRGCKSGDTDNGDGTCSAAEGVVPVARHDVADPDEPQTGDLVHDAWHNPNLYHYKDQRHVIASGKPAPCSERAEEGGVKYDGDSYIVGSNDPEPGGYICHKIVDGSEETWFIQVY